MDSPDYIFRLECRYSSSEMMYLEVRENDVRCYLHHSPEHADHWTYQEVLDGKMDTYVYILFPEAEIEELKAVVRKQFV